MFSVEGRCCVLIESRQYVTSCESYIYIFTVGEFGGELFFCHFLPADILSDIFRRLSLQNLGFDTVYIFT